MIRWGDYPMWWLIKQDRFDRGRGSLAFSRLAQFVERLHFAEQWGGRNGASDLRMDWA
jgi:hypothetical protein